MECNKEDAIRAKEIAEDKMQKDDFQGALKFAQKAKHLFPELENISQMLTVCDVHISAQNKICSSEFDWYKILQLEKLVDEDTIKKQYKKLALALHPDRNKFPGAEAAFKLIHEANMVLSDKENRSLYDSKCRGFSKESSVPKPGGDKKYYNEVQNKNHNVFCSDQVNQSPFSGKYYHAQNQPQNVIPSLYSGLDDLQKTLTDLYFGFECKAPNVSSPQFNDLNHPNHQQAIQRELYGNVFACQFNDLNHHPNQQAKQQGMFGGVQTKTPNVFAPQFNGLNHHSHQQAQHRDLFGRVQTESTPNVSASQSQFSFNPNHHHQAEQQPHSYTGAQNKNANVSTPLSSNLHHHQPAEQQCLNCGVNSKKPNVSSSQFREWNHHQSAQSDGGKKFSACCPFGHMMHRLIHRKKKDSHRVH